MSISPEVQQELKEIFCTLSDTGSQHGIMCGTKLVPAASSLGVTLKPGDRRLSVLSNYAQRRSSIMSTGKFQAIRE